MNEDDRLELEAMKSQVVGVSSSMTNHPSTGELQELKNVLDDATLAEIEHHLSNSDHKPFPGQLGAGDVDKSASEIRAKLPPDLSLDWDLGDAASQPLDSLPDMSQRKRVTVFGAGRMGPAVAFEFAFAGCSVMICDLRPDAIAMVVPGLKTQTKTLLAEGVFTRDEVDSALERITTTTDFDKAVIEHRPDVVLEVVTESLGLKTRLLSQVGEATRNWDPAPILCTNTITIPLHVLAKELADVGAAPLARSLIGVRFLFPVLAIPRVEVTVGPNTTLETFLTTRAFLLECNKEAMLSRWVSSGFKLSVWQANQFHSAAALATTHRQLAALQAQRDRLTAALAASSSSTSYGGLELPPTIPSPSAMAAPPSPSQGISKKAVEVESPVELPPFPSVAVGDEAPGTSELFYSRSIAVMLGCGEYDDPVQWPSLATVTPNLLALSEALKGAGFEVVVMATGVDGRTRLPKRDFLAGLKAAVGCVGPRDRLVFYFAGHGATMKEDPANHVISAAMYQFSHSNRGVLVLSDSKYEDPESFVDQSDLTKALGSGGALHTCIIVDCCFSGWALNQTYGGIADASAVLRAALKHRAVQVITAGTAEQPVTGALSQTMAKTLSRHDDGVLPLQTLASSVAVEVGALTSGCQTPQWGFMDLNTLGTTVFYTLSVTFVVVDASVEETEPSAPVVGRVTAPTLRGLKEAAANAIGEFRVSGPRAAGLWKHVGLGDDETWLPLDSDQAVAGLRRGDVVEVQMN